MISFSISVETSNNYSPSGTLLRVVFLLLIETAVIVWVTAPLQTSRKSSATTDTVLKGRTASEGFWNEDTVQCKLKRLADIL